MKRFFIFVIVVNTLLLLLVRNGILYTLKPGYPSMNINFLYLESAKLIVSGYLGFITLNVILFLSLFISKKNVIVGSIGAYAFISLIWLVFNTCCLIYYFGLGPLVNQFV